MADDLRRSVEAWRSQRYAALRSPIGWLTLVGLDWLAEGENRLGADAANAVVLPAGPAFAGTVTLRRGVATATAGPSGALLIDGAPAAGATLVSDADATDERPPTTLEVEDLRLRLIRRGAHNDRFAIRSWDTAAPARAAFTGIDHWPVDPRWAIEASFEPAPHGTTIPVPDVLGDILPMPSPGTVRFDVAGVACQLQAVEGGANGELWLIFADATSGTETYAGGRFLYTEPPRPDGAVTVDFNRAYNPPCVFSPYATCPLPPDGNRLAVRIEAGERTYPVDPRHRTGHAPPP